MYGKKRVDFGADDGNSYISRDLLDGWHIWRGYQKLYYTGRMGKADGEEGEEEEKEKERTKMMVTMMTTTYNSTYDRDGRA